MLGTETAYVRATFAEFSWLGIGQMGAGAGALAARACMVPIDVRACALGLHCSITTDGDRRSREGNQTKRPSVEDRKPDGRHGFSCRVWRTGSSRWQWGPEIRFPVGNSSTGDRRCERFTPHGETNGENSLPIGSGGFGDVLYFPVPETRVPAPLINKYKYIEYGCRGTMIEKLRM